MPTIVALAEEAAELAARVRSSVLLVRTRAGVGSATMWGAGGLAVTNAHVVPGDRAVVETCERGEHLARVLRREPSQDLALLQIGDAEVPPVGVRDSTTLRVGELVFAAGCPWGEPHAWTMGIVTATERPPHLPHLPLAEAVFSDVRLAPGNSGGPLVDAAGRAVGINSMIAGGMAAAIPSRTVEAFVAGEPVERGSLGIVALAVSVPEAGVGLLVREVIPGGAAQRAGVVIGDVIVAIDDIAGDVRALVTRLRALRAGEEARLGVLRGGRPMALSLAARAA